MKYMLNQLFVSAILASFLVLPASAHAAVFNVNVTYDLFDDLPGDGVCDDGYGNCTLRAAIQEHNARVAGGIPGANEITFTLPGSPPWTIVPLGNTLGAFPAIAGALTISGPGAEKLTIDIGQLQNAVFEITDFGSSGFLVLITGLTFSGASRSVDSLFAPITIYAQDPPPLLHHVTLSKIAIRSTNLDLTGNGPLYGGGIEARNTILTLDEVLVDRNQARRGGGVYCDGCTLEVRNSTISNNRALETGGGIHAIRSDVTIRNSTISGNYAAYSGGGIFSGDSINTAADLTIRNSTIAYNSVLDPKETDPYSIYGGGGIAEYMTTGTKTFQNVILTANNDLGAFPIINNVPRSFSHDCYGSFSSLGYNLITNNWGCTISNYMTDNIFLDNRTTTILRPLASNGGFGPTHQPLTPSTLFIDAGNNAGCEARDQRGVLRPKDGDGNGSAVCDIGAFEMDHCENGRIDITVFESGIDCGGDCPACTCGGAPIYRGAQAHYSLQAAYANTASGALIRLQQNTMFWEDLSMYLPGAVTLKGGHNCAITQVLGSFSTIRGLVTMAGGTVEFNQIVIE